MTKFGVTLASMAVLGTLQALPETIVPVLGSQVVRADDEIGTVRVDVGSFYREDITNGVNTSQLKPRETVYLQKGESLTISAPTIDGYNYYSFEIVNASDRSLVGGQSSEVVLSHQILTYAVNSVDHYYLDLLYTRSAKTPSQAPSTNNNANTGGGTNADGSVGNPTDTPSNPDNGVNTPSDGNGDQGGQTGGSDNSGETAPVTPPAGNNGETTETPDQAPSTNTNTDGSQTDGSANSGETAPVTPPTGNNGETAETPDTSNTGETNTETANPTATDQTTASMTGDSETNPNPVSTATGNHSSATDTGATDSSTLPSVDKLDEVNTEASNNTSTTTPSETPDNTLGNQVSEQPSQAEKPEGKQDTPKTGETAPTELPAKPDNGTTETTATPENQPSDKADKVEVKAEQTSTETPSSNQTMTVSVDYPTEKEDKTSSSLTEKTLANNSQTSTAKTQTLSRVESRHLPKTGDTGAVLAWLGLALIGTGFGIKRRRG